MAFLSKKNRDDIEKGFKGLKKEVTLRYFTQEVECRFCKETHELLKEVQGLSSRIRLEVFDLVKDTAESARYGILKIPALVVMDEKDYGIRFYGIPSGYEFSSLIDAIKMVSTGKSLLSPEGKSFLDRLEKDVHLQVFVTPTCPYCPGSVILAHQMAYYSPKVKADMIEATEFPQLSQKYNVYGVPRTVINEIGFIEGAASEKMVIDKIAEVLKN
jgi:glutaredoxin-like protein